MGWDPVTGLGSVDVDLFLAFAQSIHPDSTVPVASKDNRTFSTTVLVLLVIGCIVVLGVVSGLLTVLVFGCSFKVPIVPSQ
jgi:F0F1-type ATP synthase membrane subunit c/vacuolar-type H+-ATPase subunit K